MARIVFLSGLFRRRRRNVKRNLAFTSIISGILAAAGTASVSNSGIAVAATTATMAGSASISEGGASKVAGAMSSAGVGSTAVGGAGILTGSISATGAAVVANAGQQFNAVSLSAAGMAMSDFNYPDEQIVSTAILQKPVDYALAGDQREYRRGRAPGSVMKSIFRE